MKHDEFCDCSTLSFLGSSECGYCEYSATFQKLLEDLGLRFRYLRGLLLIIENTVGKESREAKIREALDTISMLEKDMKGFRGEQKPV